MAALAVVAGVPVVSACSTANVGNINIIPKPELRPDWLSYSGHKEEFTLRPAGPDDLVGPDGRCAAAKVDPATDPAKGGIALQMTECDVVSRVGVPDRVELGTNERGERTVVLTYTRGLRPGAYRFAAGRLISIERVAEPVRPQKGARKKHT